MVLKSKDQINILRKFTVKRPEAVLNLIYSVEPHKGGFEDR